MYRIIDWWPLIQPWWHWIQLLVQAVMFFVILAALRGSRLKLKAVVDDLAEKVGRLESQIDAVRYAAELPQERAPAGADAESWDRIRELWRQARMRIELAIEDISDGRVRRKYSNLSRYTYEPIISHLRSDGVVSAEAARALDTLNERFLSLRRARAATPAQADQFAQLYARASTELPELQGE